MPSTDIDYSPASGPRGSEQKTIDARHDDYPDHGYHTDFRGTDADDQRTVNRRGRRFLRYEWLQRIHNELDARNHRQRRRIVDLRRDVHHVVDFFELPDSTRRRWLVDDAVAICTRLRDVHDGGCKIGQGRPYELTVVAACSLAARAQVSHDIDGFDALDADSCPLHDLAVGGPRLADLCEVWLPQDSDCDPRDVRDARSTLRDLLAD
jgi:hypothetical protein